MEEALKAIIGGLVFQIAKQQAELTTANAKIAALQADNDELKSKVSD